MVYTLLSGNWQPFNDSGEVTFIFFNDSGEVTLICLLFNQIVATMGSQDI